MHFLATQVLLLLDGDSRLPHFAPIHIKMWRWSGWYGFTAGHIRLFVPTESILIPSGSLYTNRSQIVPPEAKMYAHRDHTVPSHRDFVTQWFTHDEVIKWKHFPRYWPFMWGIHRSPVNSPHKSQWSAAFIFPLIWINGWVNNREAGDLRRHCAHYDDWGIFV